MTPLNKEPGMDRNYWTALLLSMIVLMGYPFILKKVAKTPQPSEAAVMPQVPSGQDRPSANIATGISAATPAVAAAKSVTFENNFYEIRFSTLGGSVTKLFYKGQADRPTYTQNLFYTAEPEKQGIFSLNLLNEDQDGQPFFGMENPAPGIYKFTREKAGDYRLIKTFELKPDEPVILLSVSIENLSSHSRRFSPELTYALDHTQTSASLPTDYGAIVAQDKLHFAHLGKISKKGFSVTGEYRWAGLLEKYFVMMVKPEAKPLLYDAHSDATYLTAAMRLEPSLVEPGQKVEQGYFIYAGPKKYETLKSFGFGFEEVLSRGFFGIFKIALLSTLKKVDQVTHNYGWAIIIVTMLLKLAFTPLTHISYQSMKKMQALQPKLQSLQQRYKNDPAKLNKEMMELYRRNKVNPMGGCLPMLAQIPVFIAFYQVLNEMIELKGAPFIGWIHDLSAPDNLFAFPFTLPFLGSHFHLLPVLMIASMILQQRLTPQTASSPEQAQMMNFMPIIFGFLFYKMPSGLVLYWFVNNMLTVLHQGVLKKMGAVVLHHEDRD